MSSLEEKRLIVKIIQYFRSKILSNLLEPDQVESLEVALQCLESTFSINLADPALQTDVDLLSVFAKEAKTKVPTEEEKMQAEILKNDGNELMKNGKFDDAVEKYTQAIQIYPSPTFFCNRAAAFSKVEKHIDSVEDCKIALQLDPHYSKAYGRMGLAYSCMGKYGEARDAYKKALELEPINESFSNNLKIAEEKLRENAGRSNTANGAGPFGGLPGFGGAGFNPFEMLNNPAIAQMTQQFISDPNMQNMMSGLLSGMSGGGPAAPQPASTGQIPGVANAGTTPGQPGATAGAQNTTGPPVAGLNNLLEMGQRFATMMQQQNPELVEQLRRQFQQDGHNPDDPNNPNNPRPS